MIANPPSRRNLTAFEVPLWRALAVFRIVSLAYAVMLVCLNFRHYRHPWVGWAVVAVMVAWTPVVTYGYPRWQRRWPLLAADLAITLSCMLVSPFVLGPAAIQRGYASLTVGWLAAPILAWALAGGKRLGTFAAVIMGVADLSTRTTLRQSSFDGAVLMLLAGVFVGHVARLAVEAEEKLQRATELEAATRERDRLARGIHDSVLQVLALVQRRGTALGGEAADLGRLAGQQEVALRALVSTGDPAIGAGGPVDLRALINGYAMANISIAAPAHPVPLPAGTARELSAAVGAALANVAQHCGPQARAWVLVEAADDAVTVTVRDDGPGIPAGRLDEAAADGRLGMAQSIHGRIRDLGGAVTVTTAPGDGTEVELCVPRTDSRGSRAEVEPRVPRRIGRRSIS